VKHDVQSFDLSWSPSLMSLFWPLWLIPLTWDEIVAGGLVYHSLLILCSLLFKRNQACVIQGGWVHSWFMDVTIHQYQDAFCFQQRVFYLKQTFILFLLFDISYFYYKHSMNSWCQVVFLHWKWFLMFVVVLCLPVILEHIKSMLPSY